MKLHFKNITKVKVVQNTILYHAYKKLINTIKSYKIL